MAFTADCVWEVESGGHDTNNGGGFDVGVAGFPTDGTVDTNTGNTASPVFSSASYSFVAGDVGAKIFIKAGTNSIPGWYPIVSVAGGKATLSAAIGAAQLAVNGLQGGGPNPGGGLNTVVGLATVGTPTSLTWGIDYSQQTGAQISFTDMVIDGTTTQFTSAANPVAKNFVGNIISVVSGTGFTVQRVAVVSTSGTTATCDKSLGTGASTGGTGGLGGAFASPGAAAALLVSQNHLYIKAATYSVTSASPNVAGGCFNPSATFLRVTGYGTLRGDTVTRPVLQASGISTAVLFQLSGAASAAVNIATDGASLTSIKGFGVMSVGGRKLKASNCTNSGFSPAATSVFSACEAVGCSSQVAIIGGRWLFSESHGNTVTGWSLGGSEWADYCLAYGNTGATSDGFFLTSAAAIALNCVSYGNGRDGVRFNTNGSLAANTISAANGAYGFFAVGTLGCMLFNCAAYNNTSGPIGASGAGTFAINDNFITLTAAPFTNAAGGDFSLNTTAGGGAAVRAAGNPGVFPVAATTGYLDIGAAQHADPASGAGIAVLTGGGLAR